MLIKCLVVGAGGFVGSVCRYLISLIPMKETTTFPFKTFFTNILGAFIIGLIVAISLKKPGLDPKLTLLIKTGFCGGFTTFSTFALESSDLWTNGHYAIALLYMVLSVILCIAAVLVAEAIVGK